MSMFKRLYNTNTRLRAALSRKTKKLIKSQQDLKKTTALAIEFKNALDEANKKYEILVASLEGKDIEMASVEVCLNSSVVETEKPLSEVGTHIPEASKQLAGQCSIQKKQTIFESPENVDLKSPTNNTEKSNSKCVISNESILKKKDIATGLMKTAASLSKFKVYGSMKNLNHKNTSIFRPKIICRPNRSDLATYSNRYSQLYLPYWHSTLNLSNGFMSGDMQSYNTFHLKSTTIDMGYNGLGSHSKAEIFPKGYCKRARVTSSKWAKKNSKNVTGSNLITNYFQTRSNSE